MLINTLCILLFLICIQNKTESTLITAFDFSSVTYINS
uniref:Uncharacterized protein n=1 Tax=Setaria italica TaxID=4555 RepID=K3ZPI7_SETIT